MGCVAKFDGKEVGSELGILELQIFGTTVKNNVGIVVGRIEGIDVVEPKVG